MKDLNESVDLPIKCFFEIYKNIKPKREEVKK